MFIETVIKKLEKENIYNKLKRKGKSLFLVVSGAHNFGFPSKNSDIDVRGVYKCPLKDILSLEKIPHKNFNYMSKKRDLDVSVDELGHFLQVISKANGNRIEWLNNDLIIYKSQEFKELKKVVHRSVMSKELLQHYLNFARDIWSGRTKQLGIKKDLYALRVYMTGITIFEREKVISNINILNKEFNYSIIDKMVAEKREDENKISNNYDKKKLSYIIKELDNRLIKSAKNSNLPDKPNIHELDLYLNKIRMKKY